MSTSQTMSSNRLGVIANLPPDALVIHEIYTSIQGESTRAGLPCIFVRLTGCPLRCNWCDTPHAFTEGAQMTIDEVVGAVAAMRHDLVEVTGGEPLAQPAVFDLIRRLADLGKTVLVETSGAYSIDAVDPRAVIILDVKCPSSGEEGANRYENLSKLKATDEIKFVIGDRADFEWAVGLVNSQRLSKMSVLFAPVFGKLNYQTLCDWILETGLPIRFQPQLHKHIWDPQQRGV